LGTTFAAPALVVTVRGTWAPWKSTFFELGLDLGFLNMASYSDKSLDSGGIEHFSIYPYLRFAFFMPLASVGSWYAGAGPGFMYASYTFPGAGKITRFLFAADITAGFIFRNGITISYSLRTDFASVDHKLAAGYSFRFK